MFDNCTFHRCMTPSIDFTWSGCDFIARLSFGRTLGRTSTSARQERTKQTGHVCKHSCVCGQLHLFKNYEIKNSSSRLRILVFNRHARRSLYLPLVPFVCTWRFCASCLGIIEISVKQHIPWSMSWCNVFSASFTFAVCLWQLESGLQCTFPFACFCLHAVLVYLLLLLHPFHQCSLRVSPYLPIPLALQAIVSR